MKRRTQRTGAVLAAAGLAFASVAVAAPPCPLEEAARGECRPAGCTMWQVITGQCPEPDCTLFDRLLGRC